MLCKYTPNETYHNSAALIGTRQDGAMAITDEEVLMPQCVSKELQTPTAPYC